MDSDSDDAVPMEPYIDVDYVDDGFLTPTNTNLDLILDITDTCVSGSGCEIAVKDDDPTRRGKFNRVLPLDYESGYVIFPSNDAKPVKQSPSWILKQPEGSFSLYYAIRSCMRLQSKTVLLSGVGTIFTLSPTIALTCHHVALENGSYRCMEGGLIPTEAFDLKTKPRYHLELVHRNDVKDLAFLKIVSDVTYAYPASPAKNFIFEEYLLPCSPEETNGVIAVVSFPAVTSFMLKAREELIDNDRKHNVWKRYTDCMEEELVAAKSREQIDCPNFSKSKINKRAKAKVKLLLFKLLQETFSYHVSGCMTVSPGKIVDSTITCSTLQGSSGGPVCLPEKPGYACGMHQGGLTLLNCCIIFDQVEFVKPYLEYVLPELPEPTSERWEGRDLLPFLKWLQKHSGDYEELLINDRQKEWFGAAAKVATSSSSQSAIRKRRRRKAARRLIQKQ